MRPEDGMKRSRDWGRICGLAPLTRLGARGNDHLPEPPEAMARRGGARMTCKASVKLLPPFWKQARRGTLLRWSCAPILLVACALVASTAEGATCLVDDATGLDTNSCCVPMM